jgi:hypothetical protein
VSVAAPPLPEIPLSAGPPTVLRGIRAGGETGSPASQSFNRVVREIVTTAATEPAATQHRTEMLDMPGSVRVRRLGPGYGLRAVEHRPSSCRSTFAVEAIDAVVAAAQL